MIILDLYDPYFGAMSPQDLCLTPEVCLTDKYDYVAPAPHRSYIPPLISTRTVSIGFGAVEV